MPEPGRESSPACASCGAEGFRTAWSAPHDAWFCDGCLAREAGRKATPQPEPRCPTDICSRCFPGEPCDPGCPLCQRYAGREATTSTTNHTAVEGEVVNLTLPAGATLNLTADEGAVVNAVSRHADNARRSDVQERHDY